MKPGTKIVAGEWLTQLNHSRSTSAMVSLAMFPCRFFASWSVPPIGRRFHFADHVSEKRLPVSRKRLPSLSTPTRPKFQWRLLFPVIDWTERWLAREILLTGVTSNPMPTCLRFRNSSGKRSGMGRFVFVPILMEVFASCRFDSLEPNTPAHPTPSSDQPITLLGSAEGPGHS
jgi:hypothetical protein